MLVLEEEESCPRPRRRPPRRAATRRPTGRSGMRVRGLRARSPDADGGVPIRQGKSKAKAAFHRRVIDANYWQNELKLDVTKGFYV